MIDQTVPILTALLAMISNAPNLVVALYVIVRQERRIDRLIDLQQVTLERLLAGTVVERE